MVQTLSMKACCYASIILISYLIYFCILSNTLLWLQFDTITRRIHLENTFAPSNNINVINLFAMFWFSFNVMLILTPVLLLSDGNIVVELNAALETKLVWLYALIIPTFTHAGYKILCSLIKKLAGQDLMWWVLTHNTVVCIPPSTRQF